MKAPTKRERILGGLWGSLVGDALGVPVEFMGRADVQRNPVTGMRGFGTHRQPAGTWSDDSSMLLCTVESLLFARPFSPADMVGRFIRWYRHGHWAAHGTVFDIGNTTRKALEHAASGRPVQHCGGAKEQDNGNGALMRILPVCLRFASDTHATLVQNVEDASRVTHAHQTSQIACWFYSQVIQKLLEGQPPYQAVNCASDSFARHYDHFDYDRFGETFEAFDLVRNPRLAECPESEIRSGGYVMETLTAAIWCLLTTDNFRDCVLKAVNLGGDTDTTGCVAGGLAGVCYGIDAIDPEWRNELARKDDIEPVLNRFADLIV